MAKGFDRSAVVGALRPAAAGPMDRGAIRCTVDGVLLQSADLSDMTWPLPAIIAALSRMVALAPGDLIFTGTPAGVGMGSGRFLAPGDVIDSGAEVIGALRNRCVVMP
jgi:fumarylpyruvate hydrolase